MTSLPRVPDTPAALGDDVSLDFPAHRNKLLKALTASAGDVVLVKGGAQLLRNHDTDLLFRQQSPFLYLAPAPALPAAARVSPLPVPTASASPPLPALARLTARAGTCAA